MWLDDLLFGIRDALDVVGVEMPTSGAIQFGAGFALSYDAAKRRIKVDFDGAQVISAAHVLAALATASGPIDVNGQPLTDVASIGLGAGATLYNTEVATADDVTPVYMLSIPLPAGKSAWVKIAVIGSDGSGLYKASGEFFLLNDGGSLVTKNSAAVGLDVNEIGASGLVKGLDSGSLVFAVIGAPATSITWRVFAQALVL